MIVAGVRTRALHELRQYALTAAYLYVCFGALILFKSAILHGRGFDAVPWGFAVLKALLLAKFMMVGHALRLGERYHDRPLIWPILHRSVVFVLLLVALSVAERVLVGLIKGHDVLEELRGMGGGSGFEAAASVLVLLLVLLPYFAFRVLGEALGRERLVRMLFVDRRDDP